MNSRSRNRIAIASSLAVALLITAMIFWILQGLAREVARARIYNAVINQTHSMTMLSASYQGQTNRDFIDQLLQMQHALAVLVGHLKSSDSSEASVVERIRVSNDELGYSLNRLIAVDRNGSDIEAERERVLTTQLWQTMQSIFNDTHRLIDLSQSRLESAQKQAATLVILLLLLLVGINMAISFFSGRALKASEEKFALAFANNPAALAMTRLSDGVFLEVNDTWVALNGYSREEVIGRSAREMPTWPSPAAASRYVRELREKGSLHGWEQEFLDKAGATYVAQLSAQVLTVRGEKVVLTTAVDITERKRAEEALKQSEARLRRFYDSGMIGVLYFSLDGPITDANDRFLEMVGYTREELQKGRIDWVSMTPPEYRSLDELAIGELRAYGVDTPYEKEYIRKNGSRVPIIIGAATFDEAHHEGVAFVLDITERKRAEEKITEQNALLEAINSIFHSALTCESQEQLGEACLRWAEDITQSRISFIGEIGPNGGLYDVAISNPGWDQCAMVDQSGHRRHPGLFKVHGLYGRVLRDGRSLLANDPLAHADSIGLPEGHPPLTAFLGVPLKLDEETTGMIGLGNRPGGYSLAHQQAIETLAPAVALALSHKRTEKTLRLKQLELAEAQRIAHVGSWYWDADSDATTGSDELLRIYGFDPAAQQMPPFKNQGGLCYTVSDWERVKAAGQRALQTGDGFELDVQALRQGEPLWVTIRTEVARDASGRVAGLRGTVQDISERKRMEDGLRRSELRFRLLSETAGRLLTAEKPQEIVNELCQGVMDQLDCHAFFNFLVDEKAGKLHLNACAGIPDEEARKIEWLDYGVAVCGCAAQIRERIVAEDIFHTPDIRTDLVKGYGIQAYACHPLMVQGRLIGTLSFGTRSRPRFSSEDLALMKTVADQVAVAMERMALIEQLQRSRDELELRVEERTAELHTTMERLEQSNRALQDFASIASHDMQEPLRKVKSFGGRLTERCGPMLGEEGNDYLNRMISAVDRMQGLLDALLSYSRVTTKAEPFREVNLAELVEGVLSDLEARIEETGGRVELGELGTIEADPNQMRQLMQNLIGNALKYHAEDKPLVRVHGERLGNSYRITVEDNGIGFDQKYADRIFQPFQRLHGKSSPFEGTGMGLAICKKIVERHKGSITAESEPGKGATFIVTLPAGQRDAG